MIMRLVNRTLVCLAVLGVFVAYGQAADPLYVWVGFGGIQTVPVKSPPIKVGQGTQSGTLRFIGVVVGSNEPDSPPAPKHWVQTGLLATGPGNFQCRVDHTMTTALRPAVTIPIRFEIFYPDSPPVKTGRRGPGGVMSGAQPPLPPVQYTLKASVLVADPGSAKNENTYTFQFPGGGTPTCRKLG